MVNLPLTALAFYHACDAVLTYSDPGVPTNHHAESNKWGCLHFSGQTLHRESEVETACTLTGGGHGYSAAYRDVVGLLDLVKELAENRAAHLGVPVPPSPKAAGSGHQPLDAAIR